MRYYQCDKYPIEFVVSENIEKHFASHNHVGHYVISVVMQAGVPHEVDAGSEGLYLFAKFMPALC